MKIKIEMKIKTHISMLFSLVLYCNVSTAQDSLIVFSRLTNTEVFQQDSIVIVSNLGGFPGGIYEQDSLIISFEPFNFLLLRSGTTSVRDLPAIEGLNVFPNPVSEIAILQRETYDEEFMLQLYRTDGTAIREETWLPGSEKTYLSLEKESPGMYVLVVINAAGTQASSYKIVKR